MIKFTMMLALLATLGTGCAELASSETPDHRKAELEAQRVRELIERAQGFAAESDYARAEQYLGLALASGANEEKIQPLLIDVCIRDRRYRAAIQYAEQHLRKHPRAFRLRFLEATLLVAIGDVAHARDELERVLSARPEYADAHYTLAVLLRDELGNHTQADRHFKEYLRLAPSGMHAEEAGESLLQVLP